MATPLQTVKNDFGSKEALVSKLLPMLDRTEEETDEEFKERLMRVPNKKLLRLHEREALLRDRFGSREALVDQIVQGRFGAKGNADYRRKLLGLSTGRLLGMHKVR